MEKVIYMFLGACSLILMLSACDSNEKPAEENTIDFEEPQKVHDENNGLPPFFKIDTNRRNMRINRRKERQRIQDSINAVK
jgi:hypothetical protein